MYVTVRMEWTCDWCSSTHEATSDEYHSLENAEIFPTFKPAGWEELNPRSGAPRYMKHRCNACNNEVRNAMARVERDRKAINRG